MYKLIGGKFWNIFERYKNVREISKWRVFFIYWVDWLNIIKILIFFRLIWKFNVILKKY